jgi:hypothetical protein
LPIHPFRSKFEERFAALLVAMGVEFEYEKHQLEYSAPVGKYRAYCADCGSKNLMRKGWYTPDFYIPATGVIIETKGRFTAADRRKMLAVQEDHPDERIVMVFQSDNKLNKRSQRRYSDWCNDNQFEWSITTPKEEWLYG